MAYNIIADIGELTNVITNGSFVPDNKCVIQTLNNELMFCANFTTPNYTSGNVLFKLPSQSMYPASAIRTPIVIGEKVNTTYSCKVIPMSIETDGNIKLIGYSKPSNVNLISIQLNGLCVNINGKYYNPTIGNIYNNGTSPLSEH